MIFKSGIIFLSLLLGSLAVPTPKSDDLSRFFDNVDYQAGGRIVGGTVAPIGAHPWMAGLTMGMGFIRSLFCGGSVISSRTILTAAHCIDGVYSLGSLSRTLHAALGTNQWRPHYDQNVALVRNATHPHWVRSIVKNDIGLLFTDRNIVFNDRVRPIALNFGFIGGGLPCRAAGWGRTSTTGHQPDNLLELDVLTVEGSQCVREAAQAVVDLQINAPHIDPALELCTFHSAGHGMCRGDSGSALVLLSQGNQVGVVSWGFPCALGAPDVFVRVSAYQRWLQQHVV